MSSTINIFYSDIDLLDDTEFMCYLELLPKKMVSEIMRYRNTSDRKLRLLSRLMLLQELKKSGKEFLFDNVERTLNNKPFIRDWQNFSISHSGKIVAIAFSEHEVGLDLERNKEIDYKGISSYFNEMERNYILNSNEKIKTFYEIWVKKEATLKAVGDGIIKGLKVINCITNELNFRDKNWFLKQLDLNENYTCYVCTSDVNAQLHIENFNLNNI